MRISLTVKFSIYIFFLCGTGYHLRWIFIEVGIWGQAPDSVTINMICFIPVKHLTVRLMVLKKCGYMDEDGCCYVGVCNIYHIIYLKCCYLSLLMVMPPCGIMCCGVLFLFWCGLVFEKKWWCIGFLHTQSSGIVKALDIYVYHSWWFIF